MFMIVVVVVVVFFFFKCLILIKLLSFKVWPLFLLRFCT